MNLRKGQQQKVDQTQSMKKQQQPLRSKQEFIELEKSIVKKLLLNTVDKTKYVSRQSSNKPQTAQAKRKANTQSIAPKPAKKRNTKRNDVKVEEVYKVPKQRGRTKRTVVKVEEIEIPKRAKSQTYIVKIEDDPNETIPVLQKQIGEKKPKRRAKSCKIISKEEFDKEYKPSIKKTIQKPEQLRRSDRKFVIKEEPIDYMETTQFNEPPNCQSTSYLIRQFQEEFPISNPECEEKLFITIFYHSNTAYPESSFSQLLDYLRERYPLIPIRMNPELTVPLSLFEVRFDQEFHHYYVWSCYHGDPLFTSSRSEMLQANIDKFFRFLQEERQKQQNK